MFTKCRSKPSRVRTRILKHIDHSSLLRELYFVDWTGVFTSDSVADMWSHLLALLTRALLGLWIFHRLLGGGGGV